MLKYVVGLFILVSANSFAATWDITYPRPLTEFDQRSHYPVQLLALALEQTGVKYTLEASERILLQARALKHLAENREINVVWSMTDKTREQNLLPIRIPIFKGLIGWRVFMIRENYQERFSRINSLDGLRDFKPIQGHEWPDTKILQSNGFDVATSKAYLDLFLMLNQSQGDFLPRSVVEIWSELENEDMASNFEVEPRLGVRYPTAMYFFVNKSNTILARLLETGLELAIKNGKFDELFMRVHKSALEKADMENRTFYQLENPLLPEKTPVERNELWYQQ